MINSKKGSSIIVGLIVLGVLSLVTLGLVELNKIRARSAQSLKIKNFQTLVVRRVRTLAGEIQNYNLAANTLNTAAGANNNVLINGENLDFPLPPGLCQQGVPDCAVRIINAVDNPGNTQITLRAVGASVNVADQVITLNKPAGLGAGPALVATCESTPATPVFAGMDNNGNPICVALTAAPTVVGAPAPLSGTRLLTCPAGQALQNVTINGTQIQGNCVDLNPQSNPDTATYSCPANHYLNRSAWSTNANSMGFDIDVGTAGAPGSACASYRDVSSFQQSPPPPAVTPPPGPGQPAACRGDDPLKWVQWVTVFRDDFNTMDWSGWHNISWRQAPWISGGNLYFPRCLNNKSPGARYNGYNYASGVPWTPETKTFVWSTVMRVTVRATWGQATGDGQGFWAWFPCYNGGGHVWGGPGQGPSTQTQVLANGGGCTRVPSSVGIRLGFGPPPFANYDGAEMSVDYVQVDCQATNEIPNGFDDDCNGIVDDVVPGCFD